MQLQLLDLMIEKRDVHVAIDKSVQRPVIDLMASILVAVFAAQEGRVNESGVVQSQDQAGTSGAQSAGLLTAVQRQAGAAEQGEGGKCKVGCTCWPP